MRNKSAAARSKAPSKHGTKYWLSIWLHWRAAAFLRWYMHTIIKHLLMRYWTKFDYRCNYEWHQGCKRNGKKRGTHIMRFSMISLNYKNDKTKNYNYLTKLQHAHHEHRSLARSLAHARAHTSNNKSINWSHFNHIDKFNASSYISYCTSGEKEKKTQPTRMLKIYVNNFG